MMTPRAKTKLSSSNDDVEVAVVDVAGEDVADEYGKGVPELYNAVTVVVAIAVENTVISSTRPS